MNAIYMVKNTEKLEKLKKFIRCLPSAEDEDKSLDDKIEEIGIDCHFHIQQLFKILPPGGAYEDQEAATAVLELIVLLETIEIHFLEKRYDEVDWKQIDHLLNNQAQ